MIIHIPFPCHQGVSRIWYHGPMEKEAPIVQPNRSRELRGVLYAVMGACGWGFSGTCVSYLVGRNQVDAPLSPFSHYRCAFFAARQAAMPPRMKRSMTARTRVHSSSEAGVARAAVKHPDIWNAHTARASAAL